MRSRGVLATARHLPLPLPARLGMAVMLLVVDAARAYAHEPIVGVSGFASLVLHPIVALDTALVVLALGLVAGATERPKLLALCAPVALAGSTIGVALQSQAVVLPGLWRLPLLVAIALGGLAAAAPRVGRWSCPCAVLAAASTIGLSLPPESAGIAGRMEVALAATAATLLGLVSVGLPRAMARHVTIRLAGRVAGAWIAAIAALGLAVSLR